MGQPAFELSGDLPDNRPRRLPAVVGDHPVKGDQGGHQGHVRLDGFEQLGFEEELAKTEPIHGVALHDSDDAGGEIGADVAEPTRHMGAEPPRPAPLTVG